MGLHTCLFAPEYVFRNVLIAGDLRQAVDSVQTHLPLPLNVPFMDWLEPIVDMCVISLQFYNQEEAKKYSQK